MKKPNVRALAAAAFAAFLLVGCSERMNKLELDVKRMEGSLNDLRSFQAEQTTKLSSLETEIRDLSGKLEELQYSQKRQIGSVIDTLQSDVSSLRRRFPPPPIVPAATLEEDEAGISRMPSELAGPVGQGLQNLREGNFEKAASYWDEALYLTGSTQWAPLCLFWRGVSYDGLNDYKRAVEAYHEVATKFPKHSRAPLALLRQASVLIRLGDKVAAKVTLEKLIASYPKSGEVARAKERLKDL